MPSLVSENARAWDFGPVYDLLHNLSSPPPNNDVPVPSDEALKEAHNGIVDADTNRSRATRAQSQGLGDFTKLWEYLGVDPAAPPPRVRPPSLSPSPSPQPRRGVRIDAPDTEVEQKDFAAKVPKRPKLVQDSSSDERVVTIERSKDYTSDGAVYHEPRHKADHVTWTDTDDVFDYHTGDTTESEAPEDTGESADDVKDSTTPTSKGKKATKEQRKAAKRARKALKRIQKKSRAEAQAKQAHAKAVSDAEPDTAKGKKKKTPAGKASVHPIVQEPVTPTPTNRYPLRSKFVNPESKGPALKVLNLTEHMTPGEVAATNSQKLKKKDTQLKLTDSMTPEDVAAANGYTPAKREQDMIIGDVAVPQSQPVSRSQILNTKNVTPKPKFPPFTIAQYDDSPLLSQTANPAFPSYANVYQQNGPGQALQYSVQTNPQMTPPPQPQYRTPNGPRVTKLAPPVSLPRKIQPSPERAVVGPSITMRHGEDRHMHFFLELIKQFPMDKKWLVSPAQLSTHTSTVKGIHVFVDASNIFIGFKEYIRRSFGLPYGRQVKGLEISFDSLVLLMERRRPVAKRVLAGSYPNLPAFDMAKAVGYETNILEQVYKDKDLSKKQKSQFYSQRDSGFGNGGTLYGGGYACTSVPGSSTKASETAFAATGPSTPARHAATSVETPPTQKWVEQGVDEILHLKMLESVVDADEPGTMVLATGDAAVAEYSQGFLKMVERALKKGWSVELMSWRDGINRAYLDSAWRAQWGDRFRVVDLDGWVEDLIDS
ncbi:hypothetical protein EJ05DRAFT_474968 [Pseudovirgaria hyperparasitica]|uniref:NYN domain-containing protein n=1 Tax=Pseudovirgaria hyperparasitica TaxID=470096 RepID=A0A6A6WDK4_9PEZI|nr:uncharacterized protein EJ05DRAFT_474968 [Pseudovirgaria hyperparasitica]KAF2759936.1 hypothetical protein EJ05DRAFT_474968 [Pseudovirgaria hyperparasitica]